MGRIPRVPADMPLYDILNEFQKGSSHMAAVVKPKGKTKALPPIDAEKEKDNRVSDTDSQLTTPLLSKQGGKPDSVIVDIPRVPRSPHVHRETLASHGDGATNGFPQSSEDIEDVEVIGIITLEDVFEELLQVKYMQLVVSSFQLMKIVQLATDFIL